MNKINSTSLLTITAILLITLTSSLPVSKSDESEKKIVSTEFSTPLYSLSVKEIINLSSSDLSKLRGQKLSFIEKAVFRFIKKELKKELKNATITEETRLNLDKQIANELPKFNLVGFLLGLFIGLIGVGLAHIFSNSKELRRSSWYGFGAWLIICLILGVFPFLTI